jgi:hypothetical protein
MRLREWVRRRRITTPPEAIPLVAMGFVAIALCLAAFDGFGALIVLIVALITGDLSDEYISGAVAMVLDLIVFAVAWALLGRLVTTWVGRQPPEPPRA